MKNMPYIEGIVLLRTVKHFKHFWKAEPNVQRIF